MLYFLLPAGSKSTSFTRVEVNVGVVVAKSNTRSEDDTLYNIFVLNSGGKHWKQLC